jgi:membrane-bound serine protease (ClpP class)
MAVLGLVLIAIGLVLLLVEAHASAAGVLATLGALSAAAGVALAAVAGGVALLVAIPLAVAGAGAAVAVVLLAVPRVEAALGAPVQAGPERLLGTGAVVRNWRGDQGQVEADGTLWWARLPAVGAAASVPVPGETLIVEDIHGLTLVVRRDQASEADLS